MTSLPGSSRENAVHMLARLEQLTPADLRKERKMIKVMSLETPRPGVGRSRPVLTSLGTTLGLFGTDFSYVAGSAYRATISSFAMSTRLRVTRCCWPLTRLTKPSLLRKHN